MPSKNNVSALKREAEAPQILPSSPEKAVESTKGQGGRPRKAKAEKRSYRVAVALTEAEGAILAEKAGLVPEATYLYDVLKKAGMFD